MTRQCRTGGPPIPCAESRFRRPPVGGRDGTGPRSSSNTNRRRSCGVVGRAATLEAALAGLQRTSVASEAPSESTSELAAARAQLQRVQGELERATDELARSQQHSAELQQQLEANLMSNSHKSSDAELLRSKLAVADGQVEARPGPASWAHFLPGGSRR